MTGDRWESISRIFHEARGLPADAREASIREACDGDAQLEREVRSLIAEPSGESLFAAIMRQGSGAAVTPALSCPARLGRFEVRAFLGAGGMGEVYQAHDARLGRDVAIKILPAVFTRDPERLARFEREARILAALSHPQIAAIYALEAIPDDSDAHRVRRALVLELVDGDTLADRLDRSRLSISEAIEIARQVADGLEAAHDKGVVHRDLKPANIKVRSDGVVKILDFGLAKADAPVLQTASAIETAGGAIVGTPAYMSPEQARGGIVDRRTDVWAFGCLLFEMLSGRVAFAGETPADTIAAVLDREPDWTALPGSTPEGVRRLLRRCLEKNPKRRLRDMGDARLELEEEPEAPRPAAGGRRLASLVWGVFAAALALTIVLLVLRPPPDGGRETVQFALQAPDGHTIIGIPMPSPDGRRAVFAARSTSGESALWVRAVDSTMAQRMAGTEGASAPFWSPDGRFVGFSVDGVLARTAIGGGPVQRIADLDPEAIGATWNSEDVIVFAPSNQTRLHRVAAGGGTSEPLTTLNSARRENSHRWPSFLPDGRHFIFTGRSDLPEHTGIYVASLDDPGSPRLLVSAQSPGRFVPPGFLLFVRDGTLLAQRFDIPSLALRGSPTAIAGNVASFAVSADGTVLTHLPPPMTRLAWFDRSGTERAVVPARGRFLQVRLSPDESRAAVVMSDEADARDIWVVALSDGGITRVTSHPSTDWFPAWSPDGSELVFSSERKDNYTIYAAPAAGGGNERQIYEATKTAELLAPTDWSRDGRSILFHSYPRADISVLPLATPAAPVPLVASRFTEWIASFSPNGRWIAYMSDESGQPEVYVRAVDQPRRYRVSVGGGSQPRWRRDGRELFFIGAGDRLYAASVRADTRFHAEAPEPLFQPCPALPGQERSPYMFRYDVGRDGSRTLWTCPEKESPSPTVALHALSALVVR